MTELGTRPLPQLGKVERSTRREIILEKLRVALVNGQLSPGTHLAETDLSESLGVSRGTLREALRHLQQEGLVVPDARGRLIVRSLSVRDVEDVFAVRGALEALAMEAVCALPDRAAVLEELREALRSMAAAGSVAEMVSRDLHFHEVICRASGNEILVDSWLRVSGQARAAITAAGTETAVSNMAVERHVPVLDIVARSDAEEGRLFLRRHMQEAADAVTRRMRPAQDV
ncbi:GntR family transcriptional regulator [Kineococcus sp. SYSU DK004]|uniref:GntR family transcriptional regulator n=1 Tax=Kineococcus sp. SYSU DK004 TaxID=3383125 RepID=UPI003D7E8358